MSITNAVVAGIIYALTELLALSGTGHLAVVNTLFDLHLTELHLLFKAFTELAVMIALILAFYLRTAEVCAKQTEDGSWSVTGFSKKGGAEFADRIAEKEKELRGGEISK